MSKFNEFTQKFDEAVSARDVDGATQVIADYVRTHSANSGKQVAESFKLTRAWMGLDVGENRAASTLNTPEGQKAIEDAMANLGIANDAPA